MCTLTDRREFVTRSSHHAQVAHLAASSQVEKGQTDDTDLLVGARSTTTNETCRVLASTDHTNIKRGHDEG